MSIDSATGHMGKHLIRSSMKKQMKTVLFHIASFLLWTYCLTWRIKLHDKSLADRIAKNERTVIAIWHDQLLPLSFSWRGRKMGTLASRSEDGDMISKQLERWGYIMARGSSSRGGARAVIELKRLMESGHDITLTVDGPRGPRHRVKPGIIFLAKQSGSPVIAVTMRVKHFKRFASWDKFVLPLPFARIDIHFSAPIYISDAKDEENIEKDRMMLEKKMLEHTRECSPNLI